jgi:hypothetical protein
MKVSKARVATAGRVAKFLYDNRKAEIALVTSVVALVGQIVEVATGH